MTDPLVVRRKRLRFRSWHRGTKEADLMLGGFADRHLDGFTAPELDLFEALLNYSDPDLYAWVGGREPVPNELRHDVMDRLRDFAMRRGER